MLERAKEVTRYDKYTGIEYARFADDLVILVDAHPRHDWLMTAVEKRLREELAALQVEVNEEKSWIVDLGRGESFGFLGFGVLQRQIERREHETITCRIAVEDGGGPPGIGFQERVSNHSKRLRSKAVVVSVGGKSLGHDPEQVCVRETSESKPTDDASLRSKRHQNQRRESPLG